MHVDAIRDALASAEAEGEIEQQLALRLALGEALVVTAEDGEAERVASAELECDSGGGKEARARTVVKGRVLCAYVDCGSRSGVLDL